MQSHYKRSLAVFFLLSALALDCEGIDQFGKEVSPGIVVLSGQDLPELADPFVSLFKGFSLISGTAQYSLKFPSVESVRQGGPFQVVWNDFFYSDGTPMEGGRTGAHSWDMKPFVWDSMVIWYGGHMRPRPGEKTSRWPEDNYSRDVFAFVEKEPGRWISQENSIFSVRKDWPRATGNFLGHRYGHQIVNAPDRAPVVYFEEVTEVRGDGSPAVTKIFTDEMTSPYQAKGSPTELISPVDPTTGRFFPSATREDGAALVEGPLYFRFVFEGELWEAVGFSSGSYFGYYPSCFASRRVSDGIAGTSYQVDLNDEGTDFHNAGAELGKSLKWKGGPGRPAVIVGPDGVAVPDPQGELQVLVHGYPQEPVPQSSRVMIYARLKVRKGPRGALRFEIVGAR